MPACIDVEVAPRQLANIRTIGVHDKDRHGCAVLSREDQALCVGGPPWESSFSDPTLREGLRVDGVDPVPQRIHSVEYDQVLHSPSHLDKDPDDTCHVWRIHASKPKSRLTASGPRADIRAHKSVLGGLSESPESLALSCSTSTLTSLTIERNSRLS